MTVRNLLEHGAAVLERGRVPSPHLTAEVLLACSLGREREFLYAHPDDPIDGESSETFLSMINRRLAREPLQYITGRQEFYGRLFHVDPTVLIPRPETELIVDAVVGLNRWREPRILDVGTGSGCIAATLALELPDSRVFASDVSWSALRTARQNVGRNQAPVLFACVDLVDAWQGPFEFIVSNPPYVRPDEREGLQPEVGRHEPAIALFGNTDPISLYRRLISEAGPRLATGGYLILEIGYSMAGEVRELFDPGWRSETRTDLQGIPRVVVAYRLSTVR